MFLLTTSELLVAYESLDPVLLSMAQKDQWLLKLLENFVVYAPVLFEDRVHWHRLTPVDLGPGADPVTPALRRIRASEPVKSFMFTSRQTVGGLPELFDSGESKPRVLFGVKNCDLVPLKVHDKILTHGEFADPFYTARRKNTILVGADCPAPEESCFCNLLGLTPYPGDEVDAVVSVSEDGYLFEVGGRAQQLIEVAPELFQRVSSGDNRIVMRDQARKAASETLCRINPKPWNPDLPAAIGAKMRDGAFWRSHAETCVECFGCLMGCPTCYCFLLYDQARLAASGERRAPSAGPEFDRTRVWDACYLAAYARVGGGANPRVEFSKRFANRFQCKFSDFKNDHGMFSCSGCGRCFKSCMGKIDIRKVLEDL